MYFPKGLCLYFRWIQQNFLHGGTKVTVFVEAWAGTWMSQTLAKSMKDVPGGEEWIKSRQKV